MSDRLTTKLHHLIAGMGLAVSSIISPTSMHAEPAHPEKKRKRESTRDAIGSKDFMDDSKWEGIKHFDERLAIYTILDEMVNFTDPDRHGNFWKSVNYKVEVDDGVSYCVLTGKRNDGKIIQVRGKIEDGCNTKELFEGLCKDLHGGHWTKPVSRIVGIGGFTGVEK